METMLRLASETARRPTRRILFTVEAIQDLAPPAKGQYWVYDSRVDPLAVLITSTGHKAFYLVKKVLGRPRRFLIGNCGHVKIDAARRIALAKLQDIAEGRDPHAEKQQAREETTLAELWASYLELHAKPRKRSWEEDEALWQTYFLSSKWGQGNWASRRLSEVTRPALIMLHTKIGKEAPYAANRVLALLSVMFTHADRVMGFKGTNPAKGVQRFPESSRERFLNADEFPAFWEALEKEPDETLRDYFKILLFVGARRSNVQQMEWNEVNLERATWTLPKEKIKNKKAMTFYLSADALEILRRRNQDRSVMKAIHPAGAMYVFPGRPVGDKSTKPRKAHYLAEPSKAWHRLLARAEIKDLRIHDLRRTLGSWCAATGASIPVIGKALGHLNQSTTAIYARLDLNPVKAAVETATAAMMKAKTRQKKPSATGFLFEM